MAKTKDFTQVTFPDKKEYREFEKLILKGTEKSTEEAWKMIKLKTTERNKKWTRKIRSYQDGL